MIAALTMILGNVIAVAQPNIKRMLAYSSIAHAGYVAVAFAASSDRGISAALFYLLAYSVMNLGAFTIVTILSRSEDKLVKITDYAGLGAKRPGLAALLSLFLLSLAGVPGTAGFAGKFFIFRSAVESGLMWLTVIGVVTTVVSFYYYLSVIVQMYMRDPRRRVCRRRCSGRWQSVARRRHTRHDLPRRLAERRAELEHRGGAIAALVHRFSISFPLAS